MDSTKFNHIGQLPLLIQPSGWAAHIPFAFWLIEACRPKTLVELGTHFGVSFSSFCQQALKMSLNCQFYAVDNWQGDEQAGFYGNEIYENLKKFVTSNFPGFAYLIKTEFDQAVGLFDDKSIDILHIDGYHTELAILHDFETWLPKVSERGIILFHDINTRKVGFGGFSAWNRLKSQYPHFSFVHGFGLGVLQTGNNAPDAIQEMCALSKDEQEEIKSFYAGLGNLYQALCDQKFYHGNEIRQLRMDQEYNSNQLKLAHESALQKLKENYDEELAREKTARADAEQSYLNDRTNLETQKIRLNQEIINLLNSKSWKLTAPLRLISRTLRKVIKSKE